MKRLAVELGEHSYDILTGSKCLEKLGTLCRERGLAGMVAVVTNPVVAAIYADRVVKSLEDSGYVVNVIKVEDGEQYKNSATLNTIYDRLVDTGMDRHSFIVALGGGVVGDMAGFAAATYMRGIPFVQVPTTLLAQVDSSVGGKTAIDHPRGKNLIGAFYQPRLVLIDVDTLKTLPEREFRAGLAEVVKYGVILDADFMAYLESKHPLITSLDTDCLVEVVRRCCSLKASVVEKDEKESGLRTVLNYGHTLGHAFETVAGYRELVHGEAVALGMVLAARVSRQLGYCSEADQHRIAGLIGSFGLPLEAPAVDRSLLAKALEADKKGNSGIISFICNRGIGGFVIEKLAIEQLFTLSGVGV